MQINPKSVPNWSQIEPKWNQNGSQNGKKIVPKLKPGDALVHHCLIAHGSKKNLSTKSREGITFQYKSNNSKTDFTRKKKYLRDLHSQIKK